MIRLYGFITGSTVATKDVRWNNLNLKSINERVCKLWQKNWKISPLCNDWEMYDYLSWISVEHWVDMEVLIGITYAESHIWTNFAPSRECSRMNNRGWLKGKKNDDGTVDKYQLPYSWCRLYPFKDMKEFWDSLVNTISMGYIKWWCNNLYCLSSRYVWQPWEVKTSRVNKVGYFINYK